MWFRRIVKHHNIDADSLERCHKIFELGQRRLVDAVVAGRMVLLLEAVALGGLRVGLKTNRPDHQDRGTGL